MGFEPTRAEPNGLAVHRLNHSATSSYAISDGFVKHLLQFQIVRLNRVPISFLDNRIFKKNNKVTS